MYSLIRKLHFKVKAQPSTPPMVLDSVVDFSQTFWSWVVLGFLPRAVCCVSEVELSPGFFWEGSVSSLSWSVLHAVGADPGCQPSCSSSWGVCCT